jgi:hypothetical protein
MTINKALEDRRRKWINDMSYEKFQEYLSRLRLEGRTLSDPAKARWEHEEIEREIGATNVNPGSNFYD